jgi:hypothetical protein
VIRRTPRQLGIGIVVVLALAATACSSSATRTQPAPTTTSKVEPTAALAAQAYVWGQPLVISMRTAQHFAQLFGLDHLTNQRTLSDASSRLVVAPNVDTLYSVAVLDLRRGPQALTVPAITDRYYTYQFLDMYTESFAYVGTRATGGRAGTWLVVAPDWRGSAPPGDTVVRASTPVVILLGRFLVSGPADLPAAQAVMAQVQLRPQPSGTQPVAGDAPAGLGSPAGTPQSAAQAGPGFFDELGDDLAVNPPRSSADRAELARLAPLGVGPGRHPAATVGDQERSQLAQGVVHGSAQVAAAAATSASHNTNGWSTALDVGRYGADFLTRAEVAQSGWGANIPQEAVYLHSATDGRAQPYSGTRHYVLHFPAGSLPPSRAFWSITLYGPDRFLVANPANRYAIGDRSPGLVTNADGSLDVYLQRDPPTGHQANWIPTPSGAFSLTLRIYLPEPIVLNGSYHVPAVQPIGD